MATLIIQQKHKRMQAATWLYDRVHATGFTSTFYWLLANCILVKSNHPDVLYWPSALYWPPATGHGVWQRLRGQEPCQHTFHPLRMLKPDLDNVSVVPRVRVHIRPRSLHHSRKLLNVFLRDARVLRLSRGMLNPITKMTPLCLFSLIICLSFIGVGLSGLLCLSRAINFNRQGSVRLLWLAESETHRLVGRNVIRQKDRHLMHIVLLQHKPLNIPILKYTSLFFSIGIFDM